MRHVKKWTMAGKRCIVLRYAGDNRYTRQELIGSHDGQFLKAIPVEAPWELLDQLTDMDVVALDEAQFIKDSAAFCDYLANAGKVRNVQYFIAQN
jgi:thymidine kinase